MSNACFACRLLLSLPAAGGQIELFRDHLLPFQPQPGSPLRVTTATHMLDLEVTRVLWDDETPAYLTAWVEDELPAARTAPLPGAEAEALRAELRGRGWRDVGAGDNYTAPFAPREQ